MQWVLDMIGYLPYSCTNRCAQTNLSLPPQGITELAVVKFSTQSSITLV